MHKLRIANQAGDWFNVVPVNEGDTYGLKKCLTHDKREPLIEFYDAEYEGHEGFKEDLHGQFVSRYFLSTIVGMQRDTGINLDGGVPKWQIDASTMELITEWLADIYVDNDEVINHTMTEGYDYDGCLGRFIERINEAKLRLNSDKVTEARCYTPAITHVPVTEDELEMLELVIEKLKDKPLPYSVEVDAMALKVLKNFFKKAQGMIAYG